MRPHRIAALVLLGLLTGCNEGPFIDAAIQTTVDKPQDSLKERGRLEICYGTVPEFPAAEALAKDTCTAYGLQIRLLFNDRYQCRVGTPHRAIFQCFDPDMTDRLGEYINPFNEDAVKNWQQRTGGKKRAAVMRGDIVRGGGPDAKSGEAAVPAQAPAPAPITEAAPTPRPATTPDFNPHRPVPPPPPAVQLPAPPPAPPSLGSEGFNLPAGSWGDAFDRQQ